MDRFFFDTPYFMAPDGPMAEETLSPIRIGFIPRPFASLQGDALGFNLANLACIVAVTLAVFLAGAAGAQSLGRVLRAIREDEAAANRARKRIPPPIACRPSSLAAAPSRDWAEPFRRTS